MPDISYQMQLAQAAQQQPMKDLSTLMNTVGNTWQNYEKGEDERDAVTFFTGNEPTEENIKTFMESHRNMPPNDVVNYAVVIGKQKRAMKVKDFMQNMDSLMDQDGNIDPTKL